MPKVVKQLGVLQIKRLTKPGLHTVGGAPGLCLKIGPTGARSWVLRATIHGRRVDRGLGSEADVPPTADAHRVDDTGWDGTLYRPAPPELVPTRMIAVPYYLWNNRTAGSMTVWLPEID